jgi:hypothetical protein
MSDSFGAPNLDDAALGDAITNTGGGTDLSSLFGGSSGGTSLSDLATSLFGGMAGLSGGGSQASAGTAANPPLSSGAATAQPAINSAESNLADAAALPAATGQPGQGQNGQGQGDQSQSANQYAPQSAVDQLKKALTGLRQQQRQNPYQPGAGAGAADAGQNSPMLNRAARIPAQPAQRADAANINNPPPGGGGGPPIDPSAAYAAGLRSDAPPNTGYDPTQPAANDNAAGQSFPDFLNNLRGRVTQPAPTIDTGGGTTGAGGGGAANYVPGSLSYLARMLGLGPAGMGAAIAMKPTPAETGELPPGGYSAPPGTSGIGSDAVAGGTAGQKAPGEARAEAPPDDPKAVTAGGREDQTIDPRTGKPFKVRDKSIDPKTGKPWVLPTHKPKDATAPEASPPPASPIGRSRMMGDVGGQQGVPQMLGALAQMALPLLMGLGGMGGGRGRRGFHMGRFGHPGGFGGSNRGHPGGFGGHWPYHHPNFGWGLHGGHPGGGWRPMSPGHMREIMAERHGSGALGYGGDGGGTGNPEIDQFMKALGLGGNPNQVGFGRGQPGQGGGQGGRQFNPALSTNTPTSNSIPGVSAKMVDDRVQQAAKANGIDPNVFSRLASTESSFGQNYTNRDDVDGYPSYGPFQLHMKPGAMGDQFQRETGLDPKDPNTWGQQVDWVAKQVQKTGWGPWRTSANKLGLSPWAGINRDFKPGTTMTGGTMAPNPNPTQVGTAGGLPVMSDNQ